MHVVAMNCSFIRFPPVASSRCGRAVVSGLLRENKYLHLRKTSPKCKKFAVAVLAKGRNEESHSPWDDQPFEILPNGKIAYLDVQDIVTIIEPPKELIPLDPSAFNPAAYVWKKIEDIPEERRHQLLDLLKPRHVSRLWELLGARYHNAKLMKQSSSLLTSMGASEVSQEIWNCQKVSGPFPISLANSFRKVLFRATDGSIYGRFFLGDSFFGNVANYFSPLYFTVKEVNEVMPTEEPCDLAYVFGDGLLDPVNIPEGFPNPVKHRRYFNDNMVIYIRHVGPGVIIGQAWQEGKELEQVPRKFCGEILMVKDYGAIQGDQTPDSA